MTFSRLLQAPLRACRIACGALLLTGLLGAPRLFAEAPAVEEKSLSLEWIMADPLEWAARSPVDFYFSDDGKSVYFTQDRAGQGRGDLRDLSRIDLASGATTSIPDAERGSADSKDGELSADRRFKVWSAEGDLFLEDLQKGQRRQLTRTAEPEVAPKILLDGRIAFRRGDTYFVRDLATGLEAQLADLRMSQDPQEKAEADDYLSRQQPRLLEVVRERQERKKAAELRRRERQKVDPTLPPLPFYLGEGQKILDLELSPRGNALLVTLGPKDDGQGRTDKMANFVSDDGYVEILDVRSKVGTGKPSSPTLALLDLEQHERYDLDPSVLTQIDDDPLAELREAAAKRKEEAKAAAAAPKAPGGEENAEDGAGEAAEKKAATEPTPEAKKAQPRHFEYAGSRFSPDGARVVASLRSLDNKDRWIVAASLDEPHWQEIHHLRRRGWINWDFNEFGFLPSGSALFFLSEETSFSQLYLHDFATKKTRPLSEGNFTVGDPVVSPDGKWIYVTANPDHPGIYGIYRAAVGEKAGGKRWEAMTSLGGTTEFRLSPDGATLLLRHSRTTAPPELYVQEAKSGAKARQITQTTLAKFAEHEWVAPEVLAIPSRHGAGVPIYARYYQPVNADEKRGRDGKIPAVIFIHGAGYLQNAHQGWSTYSREFFFHTWLAEHGYAVLDMDYRGSAGYGADFREAIYRHMGKPEVEDLADGLAWLVENAGVDPARVGLYGGSYGGFLTLMGLFTQPETFACGAALRPVTDWAHYNHEYTSNILNTPDIDPEAYERSSPIEFAAGLNKPLLICSPMQDDNVFFQDSVRLAQKLIELEKNDWQVAIFPVEPHGFRRPSSWLDEYKRIFKLFEGCLAP